MVFSVGAKDGTPLKVENLLDARLEETWTGVSQPIPNTPDAHRIDVRGRCSMRGCSKRFIEKRRMLTLGAIIGRDDSRELPIAISASQGRLLYVDAGDKEGPLSERDVAELSERICTVVCFTTLGSSSGLTFVDWRRDANDVIFRLRLWY